MLTINTCFSSWASVEKPMTLQFSVLFLILALAFFVLTGGLFALLMPNSGSSGLLNRPPGLQFVYPDAVNNLTPQEVVFGSLVISFGTAALATIFFIGIFLAVRWGMSEAQNKASAQPAISPP